ncbi:MAG: IS21 family transposase [Lachnospiraceae bacterium]|nr:IS21 family transposase [Lachnospiraceae bacterium]
MTSMDQIHRIRDLYYGQDKSLAEIASIENLDWRTVRKYVDKEDFNEVPPSPKDELHSSKLDPFKPLIDKWLTADKKAPRKQRHTAKRVHRRLKDEAEGYDCSYRLTATYVAEKKKELRLKQKEAYLPLEHHPGEAQADFGYADFYENGKLHHEAKYLVLSFPYSNGGYLQLNYGENMECLLEGLVTMFEYIGSVPTEIWFDNTRTIVTDIIKGGGREVTERFRRFCEHYRFKPVFMNPESGWEKGNVENKVGYLRRNELVPVPQFESLPTKNRELLVACDRDMNREHYDDDNNRFISELFQDDKAALLPLPAVPFDTSLYITARTDKYGKFTLDAGKHRYSASPAFCEETVRLHITSAEVTVMDSNLHEVVRHRRLYGDEHESMDWIPYLRYISRKPRSLKNSGIYDMMPDSMKMYMDGCESGNRGRALKVLAELTERSGFESALTTVNKAIEHQVNDPDSLISLYRRTFMDVPPLPPIESSEKIPNMKVIMFPSDLTALDAVLAKGGAARG